MPRVAWLYLPDFATDRLRRMDRLSGRRSAPPPEPAAAAEDEGRAARGGGWRPGARWARTDPARADPARTDPAPDAPVGDDAWLARRLARKRAKKAAIQAHIDTLPEHQRPPMRELGRRSEAAPVPFRTTGTDPAAMPFRPAPADEGPALAAAEPSDFGGHVRRPAAGAPRPAYDLAGAFWEQGRTLGPVVARAVAPRAAPAPAADRGDGHPPLVTAAKDGNRVAIAAACPAARAIGIAAGSALTRARAMWPGLDVRDADPAGETADLARLAHHAARHWTPLAGTDGTDGLWLDVTGSAHLFGGEARFAARVLRLMRRLGFTALIAIADGRAAARALARGAAQPVVLCPPGRSPHAVAPLPLATLGLAAREMETARRLGLETVGALAALPRGPLARRLGRPLLALLDELAGGRAEALDPVVPVTAVSAERRFFDPVMTAEGIALAMAALVDDLVAGLAARGLGARTLVLRLERIDNRAQTIGLGLARPSRDAAHLHRLLAMRIGEVEPGFGIEAMRLTAMRADAHGAQAIDGALAGEAPPPALDILIDRLATRLGGQRLYRIGMVESEVPERGAARAAPLAETPGWCDPWPRPVRLLDPPERVEGVLAELPDRPPRRFRWRHADHRVVRGDGPERIHGEWWRRSAEADAVRDYFQVEDEGGHRFWLYRRGDGVDPRTGDLSWHMHGLFG